MATKAVRKATKRAGEHGALRAAAEKFVSNARTWAAIQDLTTDQNAFVTAERDPAAFFSSRGARLPQGLELELFSHRPRYLPPPDWFPFIIEFYNCRTYFVQVCDKSSPPLCKWKEQSICFGIRVRPRFLPPIA
jgi:hypothetical protein